MQIKFSPFPKIPKLESLRIIITQKINGTNASVYIYQNGDQLDILCGSRNRWISIDDDNYGFAKFVSENKQEFIEKLGIGHHFGEWAGPGIGSGEGLKQRTLFLFDWWKFTEDLPKNCERVPTIIMDTIGNSGLRIEEIVTSAMNYLKQNGSFISKGYMKPEGIVIQIGNTLYKKTFDNEEIPWKVVEKTHLAINDIDVSHLLQPLRLQKILLRDEIYIRDFPRTLKNICSAYVNDLEEEGQLENMPLKETKKALGKQTFKFIKDFIINEYHNVS